MTGGQGYLRPVREVSKAELQRIFNEGRYLERLQANELLASVERSSLAPRGRGQPPGTMSQMVWYFDLQLNRVALVHQYRCPDGTIGASGKPDPKRILLDGEILYVT